MKRHTTSRERRDVTETGELLSRVYRRLVPLHASLATADDVSRDFQRALIRDIMDVLTEIAGNPEFRAADDAESERRRTSPTSDELAADEQKRLALERFKYARAERRAATVRE